VKDWSATITTVWRSGANNRRQGRDLRRRRRSEVLGKDGKEKIAPMMFLPGSAASLKRHEAKTTDATSCQDRPRRKDLSVLLSTASGIISSACDPVDQMHSGNLASVQPLLDQLPPTSRRAATHSQARTVIVLSNAYRLDSHMPATTSPIPVTSRWRVASARHVNLLVQ
jgi:hypothetical protein